jgi:hypothetical protein
LSEIIFFPVLSLNEEFKKRVSYLIPFLFKNKDITKRNPVEEALISVCIHEWGGYSSVRQKKLKHLPPFECGLKFQLERFNHYKGKRKLDITVTISDIHLMSDMKQLDGVKKIMVSNIGMDFSGYDTFLKSLRGRKSHYIILTNSSVERSQIDFIDSYLDYFEKNDHIGLLGVSCSSKIYQTAIRNNFKPHIQSFFLLTTLEVLNKVVEYNHGFPGRSIRNKRLLIRQGEAKLSQIVLKLGYALAIILDDGTPYVFDTWNKFDNGYASWKLPKGDLRIYSKQPNRINSLMRG